MMDFTNLKKLSIGGVELKQLFIGGVQVWKSGPTNLVPTSIDTDGSIYNGVGYKAGYRYNSSGNVVAYAQATMTGFMPCNGAYDGLEIFCKGLDYTDFSVYNGIAFFDENFSILYSARYVNNTFSNYYATKGYIIRTAESYAEVNNGITKMHIEVDENHDLYKQVRYIRLYAPPTGEEIVVTINEEIT